MSGEEVVMAKIELGRVGAVIYPGDGQAPVAEAAEREAQGFPTIWITGGPLGSLDHLADVVRGTERARVAPGILAVVRFDSDAVAALYTELEAEHPGRLVVGLGGAHGPRPIATLDAYLDRLDAAGVPAERRVLAALGPRMFDLARERAAGALPVHVTTEYVAGVRDRLGDGCALAVQQLVVLDSDAARARETVREGSLAFLSQLPAYQASFARMGFTEDEIATLADRLVDGIVAWGDLDRIVARVGELFAAGADHVALSLGGGPDDAWPQLAAALAPLA
ncbi:MAG TPA: TIGR03620 family F420-dependent LLM class oxidoreductase [Acidimicrobiales bacterium]